MTDLYAVFRPRFVRYVSWAAIVVVLAGALVVLLLAPGTDGRGYATGNVVGIALVVIAGCVFLWRQATVRASVDTRGITVRNLHQIRTLAWEQVVGVTFSTADPWVMLELSDGHRLAMMAVQRSDGKHAQHEAARLAELVRLHGEADEHPPA